jgi:hypothetical protein
MRAQFNEALARDRHYSQLAVVLVLGAAGSSLGIYWVRESWVTYHVRSCRY